MAEATINGGMPPQLPTGQPAAANAAAGNGLPMAGGAQNPGETQMAQPFRNRKTAPIIESGKGHRDDGDLIEERLKQGGLYGV